MTNSISEALKPCPFCGSEAVLANYIIEAAIDCTGCPASMREGHNATEDTGIAHAIRRWNTRASQPVDTGVVAFAQAILHGDDDHRAWLTEAAAAFEAGEPLPEPRGKGITPPLDSEAVERGLEGFVGFKRSEHDGSKVILSFDRSVEDEQMRDLRALLSLAKPVGGD